jgi:hypothetical protein
MIIVTSGKMPAMLEKKVFEILLVFDAPGLLIVHEDHYEAKRRNPTQSTFGCYCHSGYPGSSQPRDGILLLACYSD